MSGPTYHVHKGDHDGLPELSESAAGSEPVSPAAAPAQAPARHGGRRSSALGDFVQRFAVLGVYALMLLFYIAIEPHKILQSATFQSIFGSQQALVFLSMAVLCTFIVGEFDLSVASVLGLSATLVPVFVVVHGMSEVQASVLALAIGVVCGVGNAFVVVVIGVDGFIVTLGSGTLLLGVAQWASKSTTVSGLSPSFSKITLSTFLGLPLSFYYGIVIALVFAYIVSFTPLGRHMTFVGANREVARLAGVRVDRIRFLSYVASALLASAGGILLTAGLGGYDSSSSPGLLLPTLSAVFLGTAVIQPGRFNPLGSMVGVYFLATGILGLQLLGLGGWIDSVFYGAALIIAVAVSSLVRRRRGRT